MDILTVEELKRVPHIQPLLKSIDKSYRSLDQFIQAWKERTPSQGRFLVSGLERLGEQLVPWGIIVDQIDELGMNFSGEIVGNTFRSKSALKGEIRRDCIVDWSYVELWELQGGEVWRSVYTTTSKPINRALFEMTSREFSLERAKDQSDFERTLLMRIVNRDATVLRDLLGQPATTTISFTCPPSEDAIVSHYKTTLQDIVVDVGSNPLLANLQAASWFRHGERVPPIITAACSNNLEAIRTFVDGGIPIDAQDYMKRTPLICAVDGDYSEAVRFLLNNGASVERTDNAGRSPLWGARSVEIAKLLISAGADLHLTTNSGRDLFSNFLEEGRFEIAQLFVDGGAGDQVALDRARPMGTSFERGKEVIGKVETDSERIQSEILDKVDYGFVLPFRSISSITGEMNF